MKNSLFLIFFFASLGFYSAKLSAQTILRKDLGFVQKNLNIESDEVLFASGLVSEKEWRQSPVEQSLRPTKSYRSLKNYNPVDGSENLEVFRSEAAFVADRYLVESFFNSHSALDILDQMDVGFNHSPLAAEQVNGTFQRSLDEDYESALETLESRRTRLVDPLSETGYQKARQALENQWISNQNTNWCSTPDVECILSQVNFDKNWLGLMQTISALPLQTFADVPITIEQFAEIYVDNDAATASQLPALQSLNRHTERVLVLNGFLANTLIQFTKMVVSVHPYSDSQSLLVIQSAIALEKDDLDKVQTSFLNARTILMGQSIYNRDQGFSMGLPRMQETLAMKLKNAITQR